MHHLVKQGNTLIADKKSNLAQVESRNWELLGLDAEISMKDEAFLDEILNLGSTKPQRITEVATQDSERHLSWMYSGLCVEQRGGVDGKDGAEQRGNR